MRQYFQVLHRIIRAMATHPGVFAQAMRIVPALCDGYTFAQAYQDVVPTTDSPAASEDNPLWEYFQNHKEGHGILKWNHYFEVYHRHLHKFVGRKVDILEIGIFSGGSLEMWRSYLGAQCHVYGIDIEPACKAYENDHVSVFIGDHADRAFWRPFKDSVKGVDILIDDGGHTPEQQQTTLEEMLQHIRPGGVYICEDTTCAFNRFSAFASGLVNDLNSWNPVPGLSDELERTTFQSAIHSIHFYPFLMVIEKHLTSPARLSSSRHGTEWQPFL